MDENINLNNEEKSANSQHSDVRFDVESRVDIVSSEAPKKNNKLTAIIVVIVIVAAVACGLVYFFTSNDNDDNNNDTIGEQSSQLDDGIDYDALVNSLNAESFTDEEGQSISKEEYIEHIQGIISEATTTISGNISSVNPHTIVENTTQSSNNNEQGNNAQNEDIQTNASSFDKEKCEAKIKAFLNRSCYVRGAIYDSTGGTPVVAAFDGENLEIITNLDGTEISFLKLDGKLYLKRTALKQYAELTDTVMDMFGMSIDDLNFNFGNGDYDDVKDHLTGTTAVTIDGKEGVRFEYNKNGGIFRFYFVNDELVELDIGTESEIDTQLSVSYFSEAIPGDMLTLKGYTASSFMAMFADFM